MAVYFRNAISNLRILTHKSSRGEHPFTSKKSSCFLKNQPVFANGREF